MDDKIFNTIFDLILGVLYGGIICCVFWDLDSLKQEKRFQQRMKRLNKKYQRLLRCKERRVNHQP